MKAGVWNNSEGLNHNNFMFLTPHVSLGDDLLKPLNELYKHAKEKGIEILTLDMITDFDAIDAFVFMDFPCLKNPLVQKAFKLVTPKYLIINECEVIKPDNWDANNHKYFKKVFTWKDDIIDNKKYIKINFAQMIPSGINKELFRRKKLCTLIACKKRAKHPLELYTKRLEAIRWFEKHHPEDFDLYGISWDGYKLIRRNWGRMLNSKVPSLAKYLPIRFPSYRGCVDFKKPVLEQYKFSICYENARDIPGYITEKIFDCFFAGCVPVYWGANNIAEHIPKECFIDKRCFRTYEALYQYMKNMSNREYVNYLDSIESFLKSEKAYPFTSECFSETITNALVAQKQ
jgi:alpha(1,3/1,4) fucosyltransferase